MRSFLSKALELIQRHILADFFLARKAGNELLASQEKIESAIDEDSLPSVLTETDAIKSIRGTRTDAQKERGRKGTREPPGCNSVLKSCFCWTFVHD